MSAWVFVVNPYYYTNLGRISRRYLSKKIPDATHYIKQIEDLTKKQY